MPPIDAIAIDLDGTLLGPDCCGFASLHEDADHFSMESKKPGTIAPPRGPATCQICGYGE